MAVCGKCGRMGTVAEIRACAFDNKPHGGQGMPKIKYGDGITAEMIDDAPETGGSRYEGDLPPAGTYPWVLQSITFGPNSNGNDMHSMRWAIDGATGDKAQYNGAPWWDNIVVVKQNLWKVKQFCRAVGISTADFMAGVTDEAGNVLKFGSTKTEGLRLKANVKRQLGNDGNLKLDFGQYFPIKEEDDAKPAGKGEKKAKKADAEPAATDGKKAKKAKKDKEAPPF
jgi:hypothetical protein